MKSMHPGQIRLTPDTVKRVVSAQFPQWEKLPVKAVDSEDYYIIRSARVLEKTGFHLEGTLRKHYKKDGKLFDGTLYAKLKE